MENERKKAKDVLRAFADEYGLSAQELKELTAEVAQELESERIVSQEVMQKDSSKLEVGWFAFEGKKFSPDPYAYPNCQGVVAWLNPDPNAPKGKQGLILTPDKEKLKWADKYCKTGIDGREDGMTNTRKLIAYGKEHGISFPAAEWCYAYSKNGVKSGEGFLPAVNQLEQIVVNRDIINSALERIGGRILKGWILSSSEFVSSSALHVYIYNGDVAWYNKRSRNRCVRCFLAF